MKRKRPTVVPRPDRVRSIRAATFGWIDHRFARDGHIQKLSLEDIGVYLFLVLAADHFGVSHWRPDVMGKHLGLDVSEVRRAAARLTDLDQGHSSQREHIVDCSDALCLVPSDRSHSVFHEKNARVGWAFLDGQAEVRLPLNHEMLSDALGSWPGLPIPRAQPAQS